MENENDKVSEAYKKAYNKADMIVRHMPHILNAIEFQEHDQNDYAKGFRDRIEQFRTEKQRTIRLFLPEQRMLDYGIDPPRLEKGKNKGPKR